MSFRHDSAQAWAEEHSLAAPLSLARLESVAFQDHPDVYRHFGADGAALAGTVGAPKPSSGRRAGRFVLGLLMVVAGLAPIAGYAVLIGDRFQFWVMPAERSVPIAGVCYAIAAVALVVALIVWAIGGARWSPLLLVFAIIAALCAVSSSWTMPSISQEQGVIGWEFWHGIVIACAVIAVFTVVAVLIRFRVRPAEEEDDAPPDRASAALTRTTVREQVAALSYDERNAILADRNAALDVLLERGLLGAEQHDRAHARELGTLYLLDGESRVSD
ncbi:hypothetical protein [Microbacterium invictum]|uniref:Membrane protein n=1 Tax=Microbacterium invictum TaxID=515415 RepID=A0AA40SP90_9MICO|nr:MULTISPECIES: hypothetical protein [Microbacterium]MBB4139903.1 putative membrane protein [Microbacterium invictum]